MTSNDAPYHQTLLVVLNAWDAALLCICRCSADKTSVPHAEMKNFTTTCFNADMIHPTFDVIQCEQHIIQMHNAAKIHLVHTIKDCPLSLL